MPAMVAAIDERLLKEAADWAISLHYDHPAQRDQQAFEQWRRQSAAHEAAWLRAQAVFQTFDQVPDGVLKKAVHGLSRSHDRRRAVRTLGALLLTAPVGWLMLRHASWREWTADVATATGVRRTVVLADGSRLVLNTDSAVNVVFSETARRLRLVAGEILVTTHADPAPSPRPFLVDTSAGVVLALGTRFSVRQRDDGWIDVAVFEHAVEMRSIGGAVQRLSAGMQSRFNSTGVGDAAPVADTAALWERGMLLAQDMRLADVLAELARHRPGRLVCHPAVADLRVSGAISLADTDAGLAALAQTLPIRITQRTRYWVSVVPAN